VHRTPIAFNCLQLSPRALSPQPHTNYHDLAALHRNEVPRRSEVPHRNEVLYLNGVPHQGGSMLPVTVSDLNKDAMRSDVSPTLTQWVGHLTARFRPRIAQAVRENSDLTFRISDIRAGKLVLSYFQSKLLRSHAAGFNMVQAQLIQVYMGLDASLRRDLFESTQATTVDQYRELLMEKEEIWSDIYTANRTSFRSQSPQQRPVYQPRPAFGNTIS
jgi:hypothetical protein